MRRFYHATSRETLVPILRSGYLAPPVYISTCPKLAYDYADHHGVMFEVYPPSRASMSPDGPIPEAFRVDVPVKVARLMVIL